MKLYAISDLHWLKETNRQALAALPAYPEDWLILGGDIGETEELLRFALAILTRGSSVYYGCLAITIYGHCGTIQFFACGRKPGP